MSVRCWLCDGPPPEIPRDDHGGVKFAALPERLCAAHRSKFDRMMDRGLAVVKVKVPDGRQRTRVIRTGS